MFLPIGEMLEGGGLGGVLSMDYRRSFNFPPRGRQKKWLWSFKGTCNKITCKRRRKQLQKWEMSTKKTPYLALYLNISAFGFKPCQVKQNKNKKKTKNWMQCIFFYLHICVYGVALVFWDVVMDHSSLWETWLEGGRRNPTGYMQYCFPLAVQLCSATHGFLYGTIESWCLFS